MSQTPAAAPSLCDLLREGAGGRHQALSDPESANSGRFAARPRAFGRAFLIRGAEGI
jgi:hypothetical protein